MNVGATYLLSADVKSAVLLDAVRAAYPGALIAGFGADMAVLKGVGHPRLLTDAWNLAKAQGWQGVGHTRMATESAVTPAGCHPYTVGAQQCMVHNGSFREPRHNQAPTAVRGNRTSTARTTPKWVLGSSPSNWPTAATSSPPLKELCATFDGFYTFACLQPGLVRRSPRCDRLQARRNR